MDDDFIKNQLFFLYKVKLLNWLLNLKNYKNTLKKNNKSEIAQSNIIHPNNPFAPPTNPFDKIEPILFLIV